MELLYRNRCYILITKPRSENLNKDWKKRYWFNSVTKQMKNQKWVAFNIKNNIRRQFY